MKLKRLIYKVLGILGILLTDKIHLRDLFDKTNFNNIKDFLISGVLVNGLTRPILAGY